MSERFLNDRVTLLPGDCLAVLPTLEENSIDSVCCDPPYALVSIAKRFGKDGAAPAKSNGASGVYKRASAGFMQVKWDTGAVAFDAEIWKLVMRAMKPGAHLIAFGGTRTYHRLAAAIEDAGFEIRDQIGWCFGSGFPKSHNIGKAIDRAAGAEREVIGRAPNWKVSSKWREAEGRDDRPDSLLNITAPATDIALQWEGWGTALKPAWEPIVIARKPLSEPTIAANVLRWGCGALNIDACRVPTDETITATRNVALGSSSGGVYGAASVPGVYQQRDAGRWPANIIHDGSEEVLAAFPAQTSVTGKYRDTETVEPSYNGNVFGKRAEPRDNTYANDSGSAARFFYTAKADGLDRIGSRHPTVKPLDLMQYLVRLVTPPRGLVLDPFAGTGTTGEAAWREGFNAVLIEREAEYQGDIRRRMKLALAGPDERARESIKERMKGKPVDAGPLFAEAAE